MDAGSSTTAWYRRPALKTASRVAAWGCVAALAVLSLAPAEEVVRTGLGGRIEHVVAYAGTAAVAALAYGERGVVRILLPLVGYAAVLEFLQRYAPGRVSSLGDFLFSGAGVLLGTAAFVLARRVLARADAVGGQRTPGGDSC